MVTQIQLENAACNLGTSFITLEGKQFILKPFTDSWTINPQQSANISSTLFHDVNFPPHNVRMWLLHIVHNP